MATNIPSRALHDLGLAAWFGGTLANAVSLNPAAAKAATPSATGAVANEGWDRWTPVNAAAIGAHLMGSVGQLAANRDRVAAQRGVASMAIAKTVLTAAALGVTGYSRVLGKKVSQHQALPAESGTQPTASTPADAAQALRRLQALQWAIPALTGALVVISAFAGEQQRPSELRNGLVERLGLGLDRKAA